jgi:hypothetical protein
MACEDTEQPVYADGQLAPEHRVEVEAAMVGSADATRPVSSMRAAALPYAAAFEAQTLPPVPQALSHRIAALVSTETRQRPGPSARPKLPPRGRGSGGARLRARTRTAHAAKPRATKRSQ